MNSVPLGITAIQNVACVDADKAPAPLLREIYHKPPLIENIL